MNGTNTEQRLLGLAKSKTIDTTAETREHAYAINTNIVRILNNDSCRGGERARRMLGFNIYYFTGHNFFERILLTFLVSHIISFAFNKIIIYLLVTKLYIKLL